LCLTCTSFDSPAFAKEVPAGLSEVVRGVPNAVWLSNLTVPGTARRADGTPALSSRPAIEGRSSDIVYFTPVGIVKWELFRCRCLY
jgi:hypothetical protein